MTDNLPAVRTPSVPDKIAYAKALADASMLPRQYQRQPANVLLAVEMGEALRLHPFTAIQSIHVIDGKPAASAALISALVRRAGHRLRITGDSEKAVAEIVRNDDPDFTYRAEWTIARAVDSGLVEMKDGRLWARDSQGRPKPWERYPAAMLKARALTEVARDACQEALSGVQYTPEELGAHVNADGEPITITVEPVESSGRDWAAEIDAANSLEKLTALWHEAAELNERTPDLEERMTARAVVFQIEAGEADVDLGDGL